MARRSTIRDTRRGGIALAALIALPVILLAFVVGLSSRLYHDIHTRMQAEADAATLAGADALLGDDMLRGRILGGTNRDALFAVLENGRVEIREYAKQNPVSGGFSVPEWNTTTPADGDIQYGAYDRTSQTPFSAVPILDGMGVPQTNLQTINSVRVFMRRTHALNNPLPVPRMPIVGKGTVDASTVATALIDGDLQGFRPLFPNRPIRMVPIALNYATVAGALVDNLAFDQTTQTFIPGADALPEIEVVLTTSTMVVPTTAVVLNVGFTAAADIAAQITGGVFAAQLTAAPFGGAFLLQDDGVMPNKLRLAVPGTEFYSAPDGNTLATALASLVASPYTPRVYPLYEGFDGSGQPIVIAFIALRLVSVTTTTDVMGDVDSIRLILQPSLISEPSAVTNTAYRGYVGVPNLTIAKLRLVP